MKSQYDTAIELIQSSQSVHPKLALQKLVQAKIIFSQLGSWSEVHECNRLMAALSLLVIDRR